MRKRKKLCEVQILRTRELPYIATRVKYLRTHEKTELEWKFTLTLN